MISQTRRHSRRVPRNGKFPTRLAASSIALFLESKGLIKLSGD